MSFDLEAIKARAEAATPGPWEWESEDDLLHLWKDAEHHVLSAWACATCLGRNARCLHPEPPDVAFIAHARTDVPALVAEVERLTAEINERDRIIAQAFRP